SSATSSAAAASDPAAPRSAAARSAADPVAHSAPDSRARSAARRTASPSVAGAEITRSSGAWGERLSMVLELTWVPPKQEVACLRFRAPDPQASSVLEVRGDDAFGRVFVACSHRRYPAGMV